MATFRRIADFKSTLTNLAQTTHFQVIFGGIPAPVRGHLLSRGVDARFLTETAGLLCYSASLPGSSVATTEIVGNYTGLTEKIAHTKIFGDIDLEFYVDNEYKTIKFLEHWIEYISNGGAAPQNSQGYYFRMQYPSSYKTSQTKILKFERDYSLELEYNFFGLFPKQVNSISVNYDSSNILRASATFSYERYVCGRVSSLAVYQGLNNNLNRLLSTFIDTSTNPINRLATGRDELINRNLNLGTGRLDDPRPIGIGGPIAYDGTRVVP